MPDENNQNTDISKHNEISKISWKKALLNYAAALGLGAASASIFPPLELSPLVWMMLIPLYYLIASKRPLQAMRLGFTWGLGIYFCSFFWLREIEWMVPIFMAPVLACFPAIWACTVPLLRRNIMIPNEIRLKGFEAENAFKEHRPLAELLLVVSIAASWAVLEWLRSWIFTGLPWNYLAAAEHSADSNGGIYRSLRNQFSYCHGKHFCGNRNQFDEPQFPRTQISPSPALPRFYGSPACVYFALLALSLQETES